MWCRRVELIVRRLPKLNGVGLDRGSHLMTVTVAFAVAGVVAAMTHWQIPPGSSWRNTIFVVIGVLATLWVADIAYTVQREIRDFLMERVNSRPQRTNAVIELCRCATHEFRAVTFLPAVGVRDDPAVAPGVYLRAVEEALAAPRNVKVTLVSVSCADARAYCEEKEFSDASIEALDWIENRLTELRERFPDQLTWITVPGEAITVNVCHNESTALMYHMGLKKDDGDGFRSTDARILAVAKGGFSRYAKYNQTQAPYRLVSA